MGKQLMTQAAFSREIGMSKAHVTQLKQAGRLVMTANGKRVLVAESLALIEETKDVNREDVSKRHADNRGEGKQKGQEKLPVDVIKANQSQAKSKASKEFYKSKLAQLEYEKAVGLVVDVADVNKTAIEIATFLRSSLENLPDQLAPELAPIADPAQIHAVLVEHFEQLLTDMSQQMKKVSEVKT